MTPGRISRRVTTDRLETVDRLFKGRREGSHAEPAEIAEKAGERFTPGTREIPGPRNSYLIQAFERSFPSAGISPGSRTTGIFDRLEETGFLRALCELERPQGVGERVAFIFCSALALAATHS